MNNNNNYQTVNKVVDLPNASGDTMDWKKKFEMKSAQFDEVSHVNWYLMTTLNKMETEMQGHVSVIQELKSSIKVSTVFPRIVSSPPSIVSAATIQFM